MSRATISSLDLDRLRDMVDVANDTSSSSPVDITFAVLDRVRDAIGGDWATFLDMQGSARRVRHAQMATAEEYVTQGIEYVEDDADDPFWKYYPSSTCSFPDRVSTPMVVSLREVYSEREWARHPMHLEALPHVHDEILAAWPCGPGVNLRLLVGRSEGQPFSDLDRFLVRLLQPHLQPLFLRTLRSVLPAVEPPLTERQRQILGLVRAGMTNQQVAHQLGISPATVRKHLENSYSRLHVQSRVAAVGVAFANSGDSLQHA
ncbi:MAG: helix-turn-helix transcriptional regulator [Ornithinimicrobium sp.]|uniref:helix-turn-helix transcriptional regulator n=1 Tax=Ornithinimicrobium sp. TaxID=1977084 RepID=UPI003D9B7F4D